MSARWKGAEDGKSKVGNLETSEFTLAEVAERIAARRGAAVSQTVRRLDRLERVEMGVVEIKVNNFLLTPFPSFPVLTLILYDGPFP